MAFVLKTEPTPNPNAMKVLISENFPFPNLRSFSSREEAASDDLAAALFEINGMATVLYGENFVTVVKKPESLWPLLVAPAVNIIATRVSKMGATPASATPGTPAEPDVSQADAAVFAALAPEEKLNTLNKIFNAEIRPALARDGGGLILKGLEDNIVKIQYQGACGTCPSSTAATLQFIERLVRQKVSPVLKVQPA